MLIEDARDITDLAVNKLVSQKDEIGYGKLRTWRIPEFVDYARASRIPLHEKEQIVDQAILVVDQFYAHLPFKRSRYAVDPVQSLRLLRARLERIPELEFHEQMLSAFISLRDVHTFYGLPAPYRGSIAFLPFGMECFRDSSGHRRFLVTHVMDGFDHAHFGVAAEITHWNGMAVETAIEKEADHDPAGNAAARFSRGLARMTFRSLGFTVPPIEDWVVLQYLPKGAKPGTEPYGILLPWTVITECLESGYADPAGSGSIYEPMVNAAESYRILWDREQLKQVTKGGGIYGGGSVDLGSHPAAQSVRPQTFEFQYSGGTAQPWGVDPAALQDSNHPDSKFGYIRIKTFDLKLSDAEIAKGAKASDVFVDEFRRILELMQANAPDGLILDIRSNPGGAIDAAERILQFLTPSRVEPGAFHFIVSRTTEQIACHLKSSEAARLLPGFSEWQPWVDDLVKSVAGGEAITAGLELTDSVEANDTGQIYQGPVTLIVDAQSYSAADIFAAGFQDNGVGDIIGVDENTGGGGANRWLHEELAARLHGILDVGIRDLPGEPDSRVRMGLAIRRASRVGAKRGAALEDFGVQCDLSHAVTRQDLMNQSRDLIGFACRELGAKPKYSLRITKAEAGAAGIDLTVESKNLFRLECFVNNVPQCSFRADAPQPFHIPVDALSEAPARVDVKGFALVPDSPVSKRKTMDLHPRPQRFKLQLAASATQEFDDEPAMPEPSAPTVSIA